MEQWSEQCTTDDNGPELPVFLDMLSGPKFPLAKAFEWAGWKVVQPLDILIDPEFDLTSSTVQKAVAKILPQCHAVSAAMDCSTKSRIREIALPGSAGPRPLRSQKFPRGLPHLKGRDRDRVTSDNSCSDFLLAVQHVMHLKSRAAFRENPRRSLHWVDPNEVWMQQYGGWFDFLYDNCCFLAARKKAQTIRHNIEEMRVLPDLTCGHWHNETDWRPYLVRGNWCYPSAEEAEYPASLVFTLAVCCSHWAANRGFGTLRISRLPPVECSGDRREWTSWDSATFREHSMVPMAVALGLTPTAVLGLPKRVHVLDVMESGQLPQDVVYAGHGHFSHRLSPTKWENPFVEGRDGSAAQVLMKFIAHWNEFQLEQFLPGLTGCRIACDCLSNETCHVDVIIAKWLEANSRGQPQRLGHRSVQLTSGRVWIAAVRVVHAVPQMFSQAAAMAAIRGQFPMLSFQDVKWPLLEDIINSAPFQSFRMWLSENGQVADGPIGSSMLNRTGTVVFRAGMAEQAGAGARKTAAPPVVPFNLAPDEHFAASLRVQADGGPLDFPAPVDLDIAFAAQGMVQEFSSLTAARQFAVEQLRALSYRLQEISEYIRSMQVPVLRDVNPSVHFSLVALLIAIIHWPDTGFCQALFNGFPAVGFCPPCGIWDTQPAQFVSLEDALAGGPRDAQDLLKQLRVSELETIEEAGRKDQANGWCSEEFGWDELQRRFPSYRLIRRFVITQASGKKRVIDDAAAGGQSLWSADSNKLQFCSALQPCAHVQALAQACSHAGESNLLDDVVTCGEDLPDAYRKIPMQTSHHAACIVTYPNQMGRPVFRQYYSMLFGLPLAVTAFNRLPYLCQAILRRCFRLMASFYYDDCTLQDWNSHAAAAQQCMCTAMELLGYPFAESKRQNPNSQGDFLGLVHDFEDIRTHGVVRLWIRPRLQEKILDIIATARRDGTFRAGTAAKLYGCVTFLDQAAFGKIARAGLAAIKDRQYLDTTAHLTDALLQAFQVIEDIFRLNPRRIVSLFPLSTPRMTGASDAAQEEGFGSGGFLLSDKHWVRRGAEVVITEDVLSLWRPQDVLIAQLELLMVFQAIVTFPDAFRYATGVWYIDNIAALMSLVRGRSDNPDLERMAQMIHLALFHLHCGLWFEWVQSKSNWSDGISRFGLRDSFVIHHSFTCHRTRVVTQLWQLPTFPLSKVFSYL